MGQHGGYECKQCGATFDFKKGIAKHHEEGCEGDA